MAPSVLQLPVLFWEQGRKGQAMLFETLLLMYTVEFNTDCENFEFYGVY